MKLTNIHDRKNFIKINEGKGGAGADDGFANNLALKDTYLGALINGLFSGISWLWRKSKEYFVINRLIAKVINELLRGVIIYCFINNINLQSGKQEAAAGQISDETGESTDDETDVVGEEDLDELDNSEEEPEVEEPEVEEPAVEEPAVEEPKIEPVKPETEFEKISKDIPAEYNTTTPSPELIKQLIKINNDIDVNNIVKIPEYEILENEMYEFLKQHVAIYDKLSPEEQKKIQNIYINCMTIKNLSSKVPVLESLNEENFFSAAKKNVSSAGLVKPKMDSPEAGKVGLGKAIALKGGASANIGDILTKRDKEKYKEHKDQFGLNVNSINLAEIEKIVEEKKDQTKVSSLVNPENLKTIQLTAQELFVTTGEKQDAEKTKLKIKWNKELSKVYASFSSIMNIHDVDIRVEFRTDLADKLRPSVKTNVGSLTYMKKTNQIVDDLVSNKVLEEESNFSNLKGHPTYFSFTCKDTFYISSMSSIYKFTTDTSDGFLLKIENTFSSIDFKKNQYISNLDEFKNEFSQEGRDVYFLFRSPKRQKDPNKKNYMLLINVDTKTNKLYLCKFKQGGGVHISMDVESDALSDEEVHKWVNPINIDKMRLFTQPLSTDLQTKLKFTVDYSKNYVPTFYNNTKLKGLLIDVKNRIKKDY